MRTPKNNLDPELVKAHTKGKKDSMYDIVIAGLHRALVNALDDGVTSETTEKATFFIGCLMSQDIIPTPSVEGKTIKLVWRVKGETNTMIIEEKTATLNGVPVIISTGINEVIS